MIAAYRPFSTKWDDGDRDQRKSKRDHRSCYVKWFIDAVGNDVFFEDELDAICQRLQQTERPNAIGTPAVLHARNNLALHEHDVRHCCQQDKEQQRDFYNRKDEVLKQFQFSLSSEPLS